ncbi:MAG: hypothetical protein LBL73_07115 [Synergistaceae bacterium]|jgi:hypothetical protein|nr:hypothetical protein [Synergistaceae bacterium]
MSESGVIKSFLVSLGFDVDQSSMSKFTGGLRTAAKQAAVFGGAITAAAGAIFRGVLKTADGLDALSDLSARVNVPVDKLEELGYVASQTDSSMEAVQASLENLSRTAGEAALGVGRGGMMFKKLGLEAKNADGSVKNTADLLDEIGGKIKDMSSSEQIAFLGRVGIDRTMIQMLTNDVSGLRGEFQTMYRTAGVDANEAASAASDFMDEWGKLKTISSMLYRAVNVGFMMRFKNDITRLRKTIIENADSIKKILTAIMSLVTRAAGAIGAAAMRVIGWIVRLGDWFASLDAGTKNLILTVGGLLAAWKLLNMGFLSTPLGAVIAGLTALFLAVDDLMTYMEGGESYFDWGQWLPEIEKIVNGFKVLKENVSSFVSGFAEGFSAAWDKFDSMFLKPLVSGFKSVGSWITKAMGESESSAETFKTIGKVIGGLIGGITSLAAAGWVLISPFKAVAGTAGLFVGGLKGIFKITQTLFGPFVTLAQGLGKFASVGMKVGSVFIKLSGVLFKTVIPAVLKFSVALLTNPITWIVAGVLLLIAGLYLLAKNWDTVKAKFQEWYGLAVQKIDELMAWFGDLRDRIAERMNEIKDGIVSAFLTAWENAKAKGQELIGWFMALPGRIKEFLLSLPEIISGLFAAAWEWVRGDADSLADWFMGLPGRIGDALLGLAEIIIAPFRKAIDTVRGLWSGIKGVFGLDGEEDGTPGDGRAQGSGPAGPANAHVLSLYDRAGQAHENIQQMGRTQIAPSPATQKALTQEISNTQENNIKNDTKINIYESQDARATGEAVGNEIDRLNRNTANAVRPFAPDTRKGRE